MVAKHVVVPGNRSFQGGNRTFGDHLAVPSYLQTRDILDGRFIMAFGKAMENPPKNSGISIAKCGRKVDQN